MDLLSERSHSNKTTTSADVDLSNQENKFKELTAYFNYVIRNSKLIGEKTKKRVRVRSDENDNRECSDAPINSRYYTNTNLYNNRDQQRNLRSVINNRLPIKNMEQSFYNSESKFTESDHVTCSSKNLPGSKVDSKVPYIESNDKYKPIINNDYPSTRPGHAEKTTYCRPAIELFNQELIYTTMERNTRLQGLVRRLVLAREREKQKVAWNNYINELKNKHNYDHRTVPPCVPEDIDNYYNTRFTWRQSDPCQRLLRDFYSGSNETDAEDNVSADIDNSLQFMPYNYKNNRYCFPTSSQGSLMMLNRQRKNCNIINHPVRGSAIIEENNYQYSSKPSFKKPFVRSSFVQTDLITPDAKINKRANTEFILKETFTNKLDQNNCSVDRLNQRTNLFQNHRKNPTLTSIDNKLDVLLNSVNKFIVEIKTQKTSIYAKNRASQLNDASSISNMSKSDPHSTIKQEKIVCGVLLEKPRSILSLNNVKRHETIDEILNEERYKSNKVKQDIEEILNKPEQSHHNVQITFDLPTKERSTEITDSLYKTGRSTVIVKEIGTTEDRQITIAVNTDPLSLLALFRVSAETVKQMLSYMPHIDYYSYLSKLPLPQRPESSVTHYVCNICGAAFERPSQLSDHIQGHNLGNTRDCCVCRHVLDMKRHRASLFSCQHCGQRFIRAYCCQLHEQTCGRKIGRNPDVTSSLMLLR